MKNPVAEQTLPNSLKTSSQDSPHNNNKPDYDEMVKEFFTMLQNGDLEPYWEEYDEESSNKYQRKIVEMIYDNEVFICALCKHGDYPPKKRCFECETIKGKTLFKPSKAARVVLDVQSSDDIKDLLDDD